MLIPPRGRFLISSGTGGSGTSSTSIPVARPTRATMFTFAQCALSISGKSSRACPPRLSLRASAGARHRLAHDEHVAQVDRLVPRRRCSAGCRRSCARDASPARRSSCFEPLGQVLLVAHDADVASASAFMRSSWSANGFGALFALERRERLASRPPRSAPSSSGFARGRPSRTSRRAARRCARRRAGRRASCRRGDWRRASRAAHSPAAKSPFTRDSCVSGSTRMPPIV